MDRIFIGDITFTPKIRAVEHDGNEVKLRNKESEVLALLCDNYPDPVSREQIEKTIWTDSYVTDNTLTQTISNLRNALNDKKHELIITIPKKGYCLGLEPKRVFYNADENELTPKVLEVINDDAQLISRNVRKPFQLTQLLLVVLSFSAAFYFSFVFFFNEYQINIFKVKYQDLPILINLDEKKDADFLKLYRKHPNLMLKKNSDGSYNVCGRVDGEFLCTRK
ncbi:MULTISPECIES: winged helix-turn-helix domain-containing protein [Yersinia]|uniref:winged helix-turn-helix domain-containing protein n=1 Tax=Yersinia TaxID=629 RepID=UPI000EB19B26|nr:winged helix-turn-helix domain-containing protein [Yersinia sp. IP36721]